MCLDSMSKQVFKARVPGCPSVCAALCGMEVPAHTQGLPHIPGQISRTPRFLPHAHIPHISPKTPHTWSPTPHIPSRPAAHTPKSPHISPATPRKHVNLLARTYPRGPRTYPPVWRAVLGPPGVGSRRPSQSPLEGHGPHLGGRGYVRICAGICAAHKIFRL